VERPQHAGKEHFALSFAPAQAEPKSWANLLLFKYRLSSVKPAKTLQVYLFFPLQQHNTAEFNKSSEKNEIQFVYTVICQWL